MTTALCARRRTGRSLRAPIHSRSPRCASLLLLLAAAAVAVFERGWARVALAAPPESETSHEEIVAEEDHRSETPAPAPADGEGAAAAAQDEGDARARGLLRQAIDLYVVGRYRDAAERLRPLVEARVLRDEADQREGLRAYGISLFLSGGRAGAERAFRDLLRLEPEARLDPAFVRPEVVAFFEDVRSRQAAELNEVVRRRGRRWFVLNLLPPWGQFQNGERTKGFVLLGTEGALIAATVVTAALLYSWQGEDGTFPGREGAYRPLAAVHYASWGALGAVLLYGVADGLANFYRLRREARAGAAAARLSFGSGGVALTF